MSKWMLLVGLLVIVAILIWTWFVPNLRRAGSGIRGFSPRD